MSNDSKSNNSKMHITKMTLIMIIKNTHKRINGNEKQLNGKVYDSNALIKIMVLTIIKKMLVTNNY